MHFLFQDLKVNAWPQCKVFLVLPPSVQIFLCSKNKSEMIHVKRHRKKYGSDNYEIGASVEINYDCNPNELCIFICIFVFISAFIQSSLHAFHRMTAYVITYEM